RARGLETREDGAWARAGCEVCWAQIALRDDQVGVGGEVDPDGAVHLDGQGLLVHPFLSAPPALSLWRSPPDNDRIPGIGRTWEEWGLGDLTRSLVSVDRDGPTTIVRSDITTGGGDRHPPQQRQ